MQKLPMRPDELPFAVTPNLRASIEAYRSALAEEADELDVVDALECIESDARSLPEDQDSWIYNYYVRGAWRGGAE